MRLLIITSLLTLAACGTNSPVSSSASNSRKVSPADVMICQAPNVPDYYPTDGSSNWLYFDGTNYLPYFGGCVPAGSAK